MRDFLKSILRNARPKFTRRERTERLISSLRASGMRIGANVGLVNVTLDSAFPFLIEIGDDCLITHATILAHDASPTVFSGFTRVGQVLIKENCFIGAGAVVLPGVRIGPRAIVGANSVVSRDVPEGAVVAGNPARVIGYVEGWLEAKMTKGELIPWTGGTVPSDDEVDAARQLARRKFGIAN